MMLCKADFEELFPDILRPLKSDAVPWEAGGGAPTAWQEPGPIRLEERSPPAQLATGLRPVQCGSIRCHTPTRLSPSEGA